MVEGCRHRCNLQNSSGAFQCRCRLDFNLQSFTTVKKLVNMKIAAIFLLLTLDNYLDNANGVTVFFKCCENDLVLSNDLKRCIVRDKALDRIQYDANSLSQEFLVNNETFQVLPRTCFRGKLFCSFH